jgi:hypothetical protein
MEESSRWKRIEGDFGKFWLIMEIPPPQYPSFPFIPLIPKQALMGHFPSHSWGTTHGRKCTSVDIDLRCIIPIASHADSVLMALHLDSYHWTPYIVMNVPWVMQCCKFDMTNCTQEHNWDPRSASVHKYSVGSVNKVHQCTTDRKSTLVMWLTTKRPVVTWCTNQ